VQLQQLPPQAQLLLPQQLYPAVGAAASQDIPGASSKAWQLSEHGGLQRGFGLCFGIGCIYECGAFLKLVL